MQHAPARFTQTESDSIDVAERARLTALAIVERTTYPHRALVRDLVAVGTAVVRLHTAHHTEAEMRLAADFVDSLIDDLCHPVTPAMATTVARHESETDRREDAIQDLRLINGDSPFLMTEHAKSLDIGAAAARTYARVLRRLARHNEAARQAERVRLGLTPNGAAS